MRGTGRTTNQMKSLPEGGTFIWCNGHLDYPKRLARKLGRGDIRVVSPSWVISGKWRGLGFISYAVDHAFCWVRRSDRELDAWDAFRDYMRTHEDRLK